MNTASKNKKITFALVSILLFTVIAMAALSFLTERTEPRVNEFKFIKAPDGQNLQVALHEPNWDGVADVDDDGFNWHVTYNPPGVALDDNLSDYGNVLAANMGQGVSIPKNPYIRNLEPPIGGKEMWVALKISLVDADGKILTGSDVNLTALWDALRFEGAPVLGISGGFLEAEGRAWTILDSKNPASKYYIYQNADRSAAKLKPSYATHPLFQSVKTDANLQPILDALNCTDGVFHIAVQGFVADANDPMADLDEFKGWVMGPDANES